jgi:hypothetical protein
VRLAEQLEEPILLRRVVVTPRDGEPDLGVQRDGSDGLFSQVLDAQLEEEGRDGGELQNLSALYTKVQIRHRQAPTGRDPSPPGLIADR